MSRRIPKRPPRQRRNRNEYTSNANTHLVGTTVSVVQKHDQPTGRQTTGVVSEILTNKSTHPRGIKVRLVDGTVGRIATGAAECSSQLEEHQQQQQQQQQEEYSTRAKSTTLGDYLQLPSSTRHQEDSSFTTEMDDDWECGTCTFHNSRFLQECELCQTPRTTAASKPN